MINIFVAISLLIIASPDSNYTSLVDKAKNQKSEGNYRSAINLYRTAISQKSEEDKGQFPEDMVDLASCYYKMKNTDSTVYFLNLAIDSGLNQVFSLSDVESFYPLITNPVWEEVLQKMYAKYEKVNSKYNTSVGVQLLKILQKDQYLRNLYDYAEAKKANLSLDSLTKVIQKQDESNVTILTKIFDKYGYPGSSLVGGWAMDAAFFIAQHAPLKIQKKYFHLLQTAAEKEELTPILFAFYVDRVRVNEGKKQLYGTQYITGKDGKKTLAPIEDPKNLNSRRKKLGFPPI